jgi:DNA-binding transcriptional MerR regulator
MLRIGEFSKICQVSVKALRHWSDIGLLLPAKVDEQTGYRYYGIEQIQQVNRIQALKTMGLSLPEIADLLAQNMSSDEIRRLLVIKQRELQQEMTYVAERLAVIESRLRQIDRAGVIPGYETVLKPVPAQKMIAIRETISDMEALVNLLEETHAYARQKDTTNLLAVFHDDGYQTEAVDVEVGFPVEGQIDWEIPLSTGRRMSITQLPELALVASTVHHGTWLTLAEGYEYLGIWIETSGYSIIGHGREIFHHIDWANEQKATVTELQFPVKKR